MSEQPALTVRANVDPELRAALARLPDFGTLSTATLPDFRTLLRGAPAAIGDDPRLIVERIEITDPVLDIVVPAILYRPSDARSACPVLLNIHGGGFVLGDAARDDAEMRRLAIRHHMVVVSIDYRLAPEAPFPAAIDDAWAALCWIDRASADLMLDRERIAVRGVSAGGGIAAGLALRARDQGGPPLAWLWLLYPMLDDRTRGDPASDPPVWPAAANHVGWAAYLGDRDRHVSAYAAPARADTLRGLPPTFIATGSIDLFAPENLAFAQRLVQDGVTVELHLYPGAYHGFNLVADATVAQRYADDADRALRRRLLAAVPFPPAQRLPE